MSKKKEEFELLYQRGKKLFERLNRPSQFEEPLKDSIIIANIGKDNNNRKQILDNLFIQFIRAFS